jgi:hypothetical protein
LRKSQATNTRQALSWNPQDTRRRGRPNNTWTRDLEKDRSNIGKSWRELEKYSQRIGGLGMQL